MVDVVTVEALSPAAAGRVLELVPHESRVDVTFTEDGVAWARLSVSPMTRTARAIFPLYADGVQGDTRKRGQAGVMVRSNVDAPVRRDERHAVSVVVARAARMYREG